MTLPDYELTFYMDVVANRACFQGPLIYSDEWNPGPLFLTSGDEMSKMLLAYEALSSEIDSNPLL